MTTTTEVPSQHSLGLRTVARNSIIGYVSLFLLLGLGFVIKILLARTLSPAEFGVLLTGQAITGFALVVAELSLPEAAARFVGMYSQDLGRSRAVLKRAVALSVPFGIVFALGIAGSARWISEFIYQQEDLAGVLVILAIGLPLTSLGDVVAGAARGIGQLWVKATLADLVRAVCVIGGLGILMVTGVHSVTMSAAAYFGAALVSMILVMVWRQRSPLQWQLETVSFPARELLSYGLPLLAAGLLAGPVVNSLIPLLLAGVVSAQSVAFYNLAGALMVFVSAPMYAIELAALPMWAGQGSKELKITYALFTRWGLMVGLVLFVPIMLCPVELLTSLFGPEYAPAAPLVQVLAVMALFNVALGPNAGMLKAIGQTRVLFLLQAVAAAAMIVAAPLLIGTLGVMGATLAFAGGGMLSNSLFSLRLAKNGIHPVNGLYLRTLLAGGGALAITAVIGGWLGRGLVNVLLTTTLFASAYGGLLLLLHAFDDRDVRVMRRGRITLVGFLRKTD